MRRVAKHFQRSAIGFTLVAIFIFVALFGPYFTSTNPQAIDLLHEYRAPSAAHLLGTGDNGVDLFSAMLHGARLAGLVGFLVVGISVAIGGTIGTLAGYRGGRLDRSLMDFADLVQAFPSVLLNIAILAVVARPGIIHLILALTANGWVLYARIARAQTLTLRGRDFVEAARALGYTDARILFRHILPNLFGPLVVQATSGLGGAVLAESTLSFLGLGPGKGQSWGAILDQGSAVLLRFPHVALVSGSAIALTVLGFNLAGDGLRDWMDPKKR